MFIFSVAREKIGWLFHLHSGKSSMHILSSPSSTWKAFTTANSWFSLLLQFSNPSKNAWKIFLYIFFLSSQWNSLSLSFTLIVCFSNFLLILVVQIKWKLNKNKEKNVKNQLMYVHRLENLLEKVFSLSKNGKFTLKRFIYTTERQISKKGYIKSSRRKIFQFLCEYKWMKGKKLFLFVRKIEKKI
jgi:hypothetical protein